MSGARPGSPVRGSRSGRPIMAVLDLLGRRWALRILWELRGGPLSFRKLRAQCGGISPTVLNARLGELRDAGIVDAREGTGYRLTRVGAELLNAISPIDAWSKRWAARLAREQEQD